MCFIVFFFEDITDNLNFLYFFNITLTPGERNNDWLPAQEQKESVGWVSRQDDYEKGWHSGGIYVHHVGVMLESCPDGRRKRKSRFAR